MDLWIKRVRSASRACDRVLLVGTEISGRVWSDSNSEKAMYDDTIRVKVNEREVFSVRVGVHQGSVLTPLLLVLFVIVLKALSIEKSEKACS